MDSEHILKLEPTKFAESLDVDCEIRCVKDNLVFGVTINNSSVY